jgi:hypothetical protein
MKPIDNIFNKLSKLTSVTKFWTRFKWWTYIYLLFANSDVRKKLSYLPLLGKKATYLSTSYLWYVINSTNRYTNVLEHGISVNKYFNDLTNDMKLDWNYPPGFK